MTINIELTPQTEAWLNAEAKQLGLPPRDFVRRVLEERAATSAQATSVVAKKATAIAYLAAKLKADATDDPEEIRKANEEVDGLKRALNANRAATGERLVFP